MRRIVAVVALSLLVTACSGGGGGGGGGVQSVTPPVNRNVASITLGGTTSLTAGTPSSFMLTVTAANSSGRTISGDYAQTIALTDSDTTGATSISPTTVSNSTTQVTVSYNGSGGFTGATITASATGATSGTLTIASGPTCTTISNVQGYYPCDLQLAYSLPVSEGTGQTVAIVDAYDDPNAESDLGEYRSTFGLPACTTANGCFKKVNQSGQQSSYPSADSGWAEEESLDLDMVSAICPNCHIILVEANSNNNGDLYTAEDEAVKLGATEVSNSWAGGEYSGETSDDTHFNHPGVVITFAAGDSGYQEGTQYPAASQYVTAVGGTSLSPAANARGWNETVWSNSTTQGTGSGCSAYEPKPSWQTDSGCTKRMGNDIAAVADPDTGVAVYDTYSDPGWMVFGGTSVATPIVAAEYALAGNAANVTYGSYPYEHPGYLNDVTSGSNGTCTPAYFCTAEVGYDGPTGMGTPDGTGGLGSLIAKRVMLKPRYGYRHILMVPPGSPVRRSCAATGPGQMSCLALRVINSH
jgi:subtilase family serine protease